MAFTRRILLHIHTKGNAIDRGDAKTIESALLANTTGVTSFLCNTLP